jgi:hypothetical protein
MIFYITVNTQAQNSLGSAFSSSVVHVLFESRHQLYKTSQYLFKFWKYLYMMKSINLLKPACIT